MANGLRRKVVRTPLRTHELDIRECSPLEERRLKARRRKKEATVPRVLTPDFRVDERTSRQETTQSEKKAQLSPLAIRRRARQGQVRTKGYQR